MASKASDSRKPQITRWAELLEQESEAMWKGQLGTMSVIFSVLLVCPTVYYALIRLVLTVLPAVGLEVIGSSGQPDEEWAMMCLTRVPLLPGRVDAD